jgi:hypothetical protein
MSALLFLSSDDFHIVTGAKADAMCHSIPGLSLILFYSTQCVHCKELIPIFKKLPGTIGGCQFGMINVSLNKPCVRMSKDTTSEIKYVPYILLYVNGRPRTSYRGPHGQQEISQFVFEMSKQLNKQKFTKAPQKQQAQHPSIKEDPNGGVSSYGACPLKGFSDICYLEFDDAYGKETNIKRAPTERRRLPSASGM